ncbi:MAG: metalloregulator ArsR/SmtB family transcription factor [Gammaproteobacteria bacterium]|nr:metalloregulator ArsR/SmtB family transcription factor [Gammaproteobacteria bacterium]
MDFSTDNLFRALSDSTRLRCLALLAAKEQLCVCELTYALGISQPKISRHLAYLREAGLVADRRAGIWIYYRLAPRLPRWVRKVIITTVSGLAKQAPYYSDLSTLKAMPNRPGTLGCG